MNLDKFFNAKNIAIVGVSQNPNKIGHTVFRNLIDIGFDGEIFPVNPKGGVIFNKPIYTSLSKIRHKIDLVLLAVPAKFVLGVIKQCGKKKIKNIVIYAAGFKEIGNDKLERDLIKLLNKYNIKCMGVNCLGSFDSYTNLDTIFNPRHKMSRPEQGGISFICQSGAVGASTLDMMKSKGYGLSKFISYGNATNVDETDFLEYLGKDDNTKVICMYIEGVKDGKKFMKVAKEVSKRKPIIAIKGGITEAGHKAALSHTGSLAGIAEIYLGAFKQVNIINAETMEEMFDYARILENTVKPKGKRVQVITNGGGYGILATDAIIKNGLSMAQMSKENKKELKKHFSDIVTVANPIDLVGNATAEEYGLAIETSLKDDKVDIILIILLFQTPMLNPNVVNIISELNDQNKKPIIVVSAGGDFTEILKRNMEDSGIVCYNFPNDAVKPMSKLVDYYLN